MYMINVAYTTITTASSLSLLLFFRFFRSYVVITYSYVVLWRILSFFFIFLSPIRTFVQRKCCCIRINFFIDEFSKNMGKSSKKSSHKHKKHRHHHSSSSDSNDVSLCLFALIIMLFFRPKSNGKKHHRKRIKTTTTTTHPRVRLSKGQRCRVKLI